MSRGPIYHDSYKPQFSGHETFPLRYGWLKKAHNAIEKHHDSANNKTVFTSDNSIADFGVGKNMVSSIRHWATACGVIADGETSGNLAITPLGKYLFGDHGLDPYMEHPASLWLLHCNLAGKANKTTWYWTFNHFAAMTFGRESLVSALETICKDRAWPRVSMATIRRDVDCFLRTYVARRPSGKASLEQTLESPLVELGLIKAIGNRDGFRFVRAPKSTLGYGVFLYALIGFWKNYTTANTLSFEAITHEPGSPGRIFLLDESDITDRLFHLEELTDGKFRLSETAGLKQVQRSSSLNLDSALEYVRQDYPKNRRSEVA
ncbi:MAG: DUF4007 family protein [Gammaproteobacteria bacterium]|nr:DUF4007 family protein [Gammaproteobacteria bacterium]